MDCKRLVFSGHAIGRMFERGICRDDVLAVITRAANRGETTVILKQVPADVCNNCGEYYLSSEVTA